MGAAGGGGARFVCWGEVLWDLFPDQRRLGGAPANVAYHLAALGAEVALVSRVGDDEAGRAALAELAAAGVDTAAVQVDGARPTGAVGVELVAGDARYTLRPGCAWEHIELDDRARAKVAAAHAICFGTLSQRQPDGRAALAAALATARAAGMGCLAVCDLNFRPVEVDLEILRSNLAAADVVKLNQREEVVLGELFGQSDVIGWLCGELGVCVVAVTRGADGCRLIAAEGGRPREVEAAGHPAAPGGDNVGCGDAFTAVLALGLIHAAPPEQVAAAACRYAAAIAGQPGATPPVPADLVAAIRQALGLSLS